MCDIDKFLKENEHLSEKEQIELLTIELERVRNENTDEIKTNRQQSRYFV